MTEIEALTEMQKSMRKYVKVMGSNMNSSTGYFKIGKITYDWEIKKDLR